MKALFAMAALLCGLASAAAQPVIPPNELPGRERERFIQSPIERFMKPGQEAVPPVVETPRRSRNKHKRSKRREH